MNTIHNATHAPGLDAAEQQILTRLIRQYERHQRSNDLRSLYYLGKKSLRAAGKLGMAMPESLKKLETVLGWPAKAVTTLEHRLDIRGFVLPGAVSRDEGLDEIAADNQLLDLTASMTHTASLIHGSAFVTVSAGDQSQGEPPVIISARSAREATALYSRRTRSVVAGLTINPAEGGRQGQMVLWLDRYIISIEPDSAGGWVVHRQEHSLGRVPMEIVSYRPHLEREFGTPRISDPVMGLTDSAARTVLRMEGTAEFFSFPQRYALGVESKDFSDTFKTYLNRFLALGRDENDNAPEVGQFTASSPEPHIAQLRSLASLFAGETSIPMNYLGVIHDNPSSADAIKAAESDLVKVAERAQRIYGNAWARIMAMAQHIRDGEKNPAMNRLAVQWLDPSTPTKAATAQSTMALVAANVLPGRSRVTWELLGFDEATIQQLEAETRLERMQASAAAPVKPDDEAAAEDEDDGESQDDEDPLYASITG